MFLDSSFNYLCLKSEVTTQHPQGMSSYLTVVRQQV